MISLLSWKCSSPIILWGHKCTELSSPQQKPSRLCLREADGRSKYSDVCDVLLSCSLLAVTHSHYLTLIWSVLLTAFFFFLNVSMLSGFLMEISEEAEFTVSSAWCRVEL